MEKLKVVNEKNLMPPAKDGDAGLDVICRSNPKVIGTSLDFEFYSQIDFIEYDTEIHIEPEEGYHTFLMPRSSITSKTNLILGNSVGLIDNSYRGPLKLRFRYVPQPQDFRMIGDFLYYKIDFNRIYKKGDRVGQIVFAKTVMPNELIASKTLSETDRGSGGFGHTGS